MSTLEEQAGALGYSVRGLTVTHPPMAGDGKGIVFFPKDPNDSRCCIAFCDAAHAQGWIDSRGWEK